MVSRRSSAPLSTALSRVGLPVVQEAREAAAALPAPPAFRPVLLSRPDDATSLLLAAKALVFCGFPLQPTPLTSLAREAQIGAETHLTVYFSTTEPGVSIPFGADRTLLAWITTLTDDTGFVTFTNLTDFFEAFGLARSGAQYQRFEQRLQRLLSLSLTILLRTPTGTVCLNMRPLQKAYTPRDGSEARRSCSPPRGVRRSSPSSLQTSSAMTSCSIPPSTNTCAPTPSSSPSP